MSDFGTGKSKTVRYRKGSCTVCGLGTDTGIALTGEAEWAVAALMQFGIGQFDALITIGGATGCDPGKVPVGEFTLVVQVCAACCERSALPIKPGLIASGQLPGIRQTPLEGEQ